MRWLSPGATTIVLLACGCASAPPSVPPPSPAPPPVATATAADETYGPRELVRDGRALAPLLATPLARAFVAEAVTLPAIASRTVWRSADKARWYSARTRDEAPDAQDLVEVKLDETDYYASRYGSPLAYARALDVLGAHGVAELAGRRVLDIGCGGVASGRLMAALGATVVGFDVDPSLAVIYGEPGDQGRVVGTTGQRGTVRLAITPLPFGPLPPEAPFDVILSKNTLKRGYVYPARHADPKLLVHLGVEGAEYLAGLHALLAPGGLLLIYNITPPEAADDAPYIPWADGHSPWTLGEWEAAGFEVLAFDVVDDEPMRVMGRALRWEDVDTAYFARFTLLRRR